MSLFCSKQFFSILHCGRIRGSNSTRMRSPEAIPVEKLATDIEIAYGGLGHDIPARNDEDILQALQILLATRRGMHADRSLSSLEVPGDRTIVFVGPSGGAVKDMPIWAQVVEFLGYMHV